jgi:DNA-binding LytR/AlgR family response regulator
MHRALIIDDERLARTELRKLLQDFAEIEVIGEAANAEEGIERIEELNPDLIFLDIHLPKLKGTTFLKTLTNIPNVIITTAYHKYAIEGFNLNVTDYLLKPFEFERFLSAVNKVKSIHANKHKLIENSKSKDFIFVNVQKRRVKILYSEILYIESQQEYIRIVTTKKEYTTKMSTHEIESLLPSNLFKRIHRSFIVSISKIESYSAEMVEVNGVTIPIGRGYRDLMKDFSL